MSKMAFFFKFWHLLELSIRVWWHPGKMIQRRVKAASRWIYFSSQPTNYISQSAMSDKNLGWALKNGDLDRVKEIIEADVSVNYLKIYINGTRCWSRLNSFFGRENLDIIWYATTNDSFWRKTFLHENVL